MSHSPTSNPPPLPSEPLLATTPDQQPALEVVALYGDTPQQVQHFRTATGGIVKPITVMMLVAGLVLAIGGAVAFGSQILSVQHQEAHRTRVLAFIKDHGLPEKFAPAIHTNRTLEVGGAVGFAAGLFLLMFGAFRLREERHRPSFTIGDDPQASFPAPAEGLGSSRFALVSAAGGDYSLCFTTAMEGRITKHGEAPCALADLARSGEARPGDAPGSFVWSIPLGARCQLSYAGTLFQVNSVPRGMDPEQERPARRAAAALMSPIALSTMSSGAVLGAFLMLFQWQPAGGHSLDVDSVGEMNRQWVRDLRSSARRDTAQKPKTPPKQPKPRPVATKDKNLPKSPRAVTAPRDDRMRTVSPGQPGPGVSRNPSTAKGRNAGMLGALNRIAGNPKLANMFSTDSAMSSDEEDSLAALAGHTYASGDPLDGLGPGGRAGGTNGAGGVGLSSGWWKGGKGEGGSFWNGGIRSGVPVGPRVPGYNGHKPRVFVPGEADVIQGIDAGTIKRIIRLHLNQIRYCYVSRGLPSNPRLSGTVKVAFMISPSGKVLQSQIASSSLNHASTESCIAATIRSWRFPKTGGKTAYVKYPFRFRPAGAR